MQISRHAWVEIQKWYGWRPTNKEPVTQRPCMGGDPEIKDLSLTQTDVERSVMQISRQVSTWTPWFCPVTVKFFWTCKYEYTLPLFGYSEVHLNKPVRIHLGFVQLQFPLNTPVCLYLAFLQLQIPLGMPVSVHPGFVQLQANSSRYASKCTPWFCSATNSS